MTGIRATAARTAALCAALLLGATACGSSPSGPTSADAGKELQSDLSQATKAYMSAGHEKPVFTVSSDGSKDVACGKGKARRSYSAEQRRTGKGVTDPGFMHDEIQLMGTFVGSTGYIADLKANNAQGPVTVSYKLLNSKHHAQATITGKAVSGDFVITLAGTTDCLRTG
jgi:hypothetical protein